MSSYEIRVSENDLNTFSVLFYNLSKLQKQIFKYVQWFCRTHGFKSHPSQMTIAKKMGCSVKHINTTFRKFREFGWLMLGYRGRRKTKTLIMPHLFQAIDVKTMTFYQKIEVTKCDPPPPTYHHQKTQNLSMEEVMSKVMHSSFREDKNTSSFHTGISLTRFPLQKEKKQPSRLLIIPAYLEKTNLPLEVKLKFAMYPESIYQRFKELVNSFSESKKRSIRNLHKYATETAIKMAKQQGLEADWVAYFASKEYYSSKGMI